MSKILYVVSRPLEINTSASIRNKATILGLLKNGCQVHLITTEPDTNHIAYDNSNGIPEIRETTKYIRLGGKQSILRIVRRFSVLTSLKLFVGKHFVGKNEIYDNLKSICSHTHEIDLKREKFDYIISSSDPKSSHLFIYKLLEEQGNAFTGKWIQIWGDPFLHDMTVNRPELKGDIQREEQRLLHKADKIIYVSPLTLEEQKKTYVEEAGKMAFVPIPYAKKMTDSNKQFGLDDTLNLIYCGDYNTSIRNLKALYDAVSEMDNVRLKIYGGSNKPLQSNDKVMVYERSPFNKIVQEEEASDVLVHLSNLKGSQIPGKIYQYSGTYKPILFILDGNHLQLMNVFKRFNRFYFCKNTKDSIRIGIEAVRTGDPKIINKPIEEFDYCIVARQILNV